MGVKACVLSCLVVGVRIRMKLDLTKAEVVDLVARTFSPTLVAGNFRVLCESNYDAPLGGRTMHCYSPKPRGMHEQRRIMCWLQFEVLSWASHPLGLLLLSLSNKDFLS